MELLGFQNVKFCKIHGSLFPRCHKTLEDKRCTAGLSLPTGNFKLQNKDRLLQQD